MFRVLRVAALVSTMCTLASLRAIAAPPLGQVDRVEYHDPVSAPSRGAASALVTVEVFFVPATGMPFRLVELLRLLQDHHPTRVRLVYRILKSTSAVIVPSMALEAQTEGRFFELLDELCKQHGSLTKESVLDIADQVGLDRQRLDRAPLVERYREMLEANQWRLERLHGASSAASTSVLFNSKLAVAVPHDGLHPRGDDGFTQADLEREYAAAYDRAIDKIDRGFTLDQLAAAFDEDAMNSTQPPVRVQRDHDEPPERAGHPLASPPLALAGLPSFGAPGVAAAVPIVVLCRPSDAGCGALLRVVSVETKLYPDAVSVLWAPWFEIGRDDAADLTLLGDAALCAEAIGSDQGDLTTSPGWAWITEQYAELRSAAKKLTPDGLIDSVAARLGVDHRRLSACRARMASTTLGWIEAAQRSGVPHASTVIVIGGRIYERLVDQTVIHRLVEAELAPGILGSLPRGRDP